MPLHQMTKFQPDSVSIASGNAEGSKSYLHLLIAATTSNKYLCRLLLSAAVLNYPVPTLINWGAEIDHSPFDQHLDKVNRILEYLKSFALEDGEDLVIIVDAYRVLFQLRSDVLIRRFFAVREAADQRAALAVEPQVASRHQIQHTVIFGSDKLCWPSRRGKRHACWAVPQFPLPPNSFGTFDDTGVVDTAAGCNSLSSPLAQLRDNDGCCS